METSKLLETGILKCHLIVGSLRVHPMNESYYKFCSHRYKFLKNICNEMDLKPSKKQKILREEKIEVPTTRESTHVI